jgi:hypothetical protein
VEEERESAIGNRKRRKMVSPLELGHDNPVGKRKH